ncbi:MAG: hypothetical protein ACRBCK_12585 [Alphaproteobacteria bacterium]
MTDSYKIDPALCDLDPSALFRMAEYMERQAEIILALARKKQLKIDRGVEIDRQIQYLKNTPTTVIKKLRRGCSLEEAIAETAKISDAPIVTIKKHWDNFLSNKDQNSVAQRNKLIMDLHSLGLTNVTIAKRLHIHPVTVSRIISKHRKSTPHKKPIGEAFKRDFKNK